MADLATALSADGEVLSELVVGDLSVDRRMTAAWSALDISCRRTLKALASTHLRDLAPDLVLSTAAGVHSVVQSLVNDSLLCHDAGVYRLAPLIGCYAAAQPLP
jgi:hypothetical protein